MENPSTPVVAAQCEKVYQTVVVSREVMLRLVGDVRH